MTRRTRWLSLGLGFLAVWLTAGGLSADTADPEVETFEQLLEQGRQARGAMEFDKALAALDKANELAVGLDSLMAEVWIERAAILLHSGAPGRALRAVEQAVSLLEGSTTTDLGLLGKAYARMARIHTSMGEHLSAEEALEQATIFFERSGSPENLAAIDATRSILAIHRGQFEISLDAGRRALEYFEPRRLWDSVLSPLSNVAYALHRLGRWQEAEARYEQVIEVAWKVGDQYALEFAFCNRAEVRYRRGDLEPAIEDLQHAIDGFERARGQVMGSAEERATFLARQVTAYDRLIRYSADSGNPRAALETAERFHGRSFLELLDSRTRLAAAQRRPALLDLERPLLTRMAEIQLRLRKIKDEKQQRLLRRELGDLEAKLWSSEAQWQREAPTESAWIAPRPPDLPTIQAQLGASEVMLVYWLATDRIFIWAIGRDWMKQVLVPIQRAVLEGKLASYLKPMRSVSAAQDLALEGGEPDHLELGQLLHSWLVKPLPNLAHEAERWIIVPDGQLHHLPFEALVTSCEKGGAHGQQALHQAYRSCSFVGLEKAITYSPSAGSWIALRQRRHQRAAQVEGTLLAMAPSFEVQPSSSPAEAESPQSSSSAASSAVAVAAVAPDASPISRMRSLGPLAFNGDEVRRIGRWFSQPQVLRDQSATESRLKHDAAQFRLLHLATHGLVDDRFPLGSGVLLAADAQEDGLLQVSEVMSLHLNADLVTLSACRSGRGRLGRGEGIVGLGQAFLFAGASALVLSLWDVDDASTPKLMESFYEQVAKGARPAEALRDARRALFVASENRRMVFRSREISFAHPRFWAAFVVTGDG